MKIMVTSLKRSHAGTATLSGPNSWQQATTDPCLHQRISDTHRQVWGSLLWGHCSFLLGPVHKILLHPPRIYFPVLCKFWQLYVGLMETSSKRAYAIPKSAALKASVPAVDHRQPAPPQKMLKYSSVSDSGSLGPGVHKDSLSPLSISGGNEV